ARSSARSTAATRLGSVRSTRSVDAVPSPEPIRVAVVGATGYTGAELVRYLARHPHVRLTAVTSEQSAGKALADVLPSVRGKLDLRLAAVHSPPGARAGRL